MHDGRSGSCARRRRSTTNSTPEGPWQLGELELDGRVMADEPPASAARTLAAVLLVARLGDSNETGNVDGRSGVLDVDVQRGTAT